MYYSLKTYQSDNFSKKNKASPHIKKQQVSSEESRKKTIHPLKHIKKQVSSEESRKKTIHPLKHIKKQVSSEKSQKKTIHPLKDVQKRLV
jgi:hypothetical protein